MKHRVFWRLHNGVSDGGGLGEQRKRSVASILSLIPPFVVQCVSARLFVVIVLIIILFLIQEHIIVFLLYWVFGPGAWSQV